jgi:hypothetical protein
MQNRLNLNPELLQAAIDLDTSTPNRCPLVDRRRITG